MTRAIKMRFFAVLEAIDRDGPSASTLAFAAAELAAECDAVWERAVHVEDAPDDDGDKIVDAWGDLADDLEAVVSHVASRALSELLALRAAHAGESSEVRS